MCEKKVVFHASFAYFKIQMRDCYLYRGDNYTCDPFEGMAHFRFAVSHFWKVCDGSEVTYLNVKNFEKIYIIFSMMLTC